MKNLRQLPLLLLVALWLGCNGTTTEWVPSGTFSYTSYDSSGVAVVTGWFTMDLSDSSAVSGQWHFCPIGNPEGIGPQTGTGELAGGFYNGELSVDLHPGWMDSNIILQGTLEGDRYAGEWMWISFIGVTNQGTFEAQRR
jgi:hypothetical protein